MQLRIRRALCYTTCLVVAGVSCGAHGATDDRANHRQATQWLEKLYASAAADLRGGRPLVVQVHVPLCDNNIIRCGNKRLGDGDNANTNLYWASGGGFKGWFRRVRSWKLVEVKRWVGQPVVERRIWRRRFRPAGGWARQGVKAPFDVYVVASAWRGSATSQAVHAYVEQLFGQRAVPIQVTGQTLMTGGAAHLVAYVGHNGWMDLGPYKWPARTQPKGVKPKATIAIACLTAEYLARPVAHESRVPLVMTTSLLFAGAHAFEGGVSAFAAGGSLRAIRRGTAANYAKGQGRPIGKVIGAFTNPSHTRWGQYVE